MDWSPRQTFLALDAFNLDEFEYEVDAALPLTVIQGFRSGANEKIKLERFDIDDSKKPSDDPSDDPSDGSSDDPSNELDDVGHKFRSSPLFQYEPSDPKPKLPSGVCILFCPRANDVFDGIPSELLDLRMTRKQWEEIAVRFCLQNSLIKAIRRKVTSITVDSHKLGDDDPYQETGDTLQMCTINTSTSSQKGFAVSTTHFIGANLTLAVVLGATQQQVDKMENLLNNAEEAIGHPLLMLGLSAELLLELLADPIDRMRDECVNVTRKFGEMLYGTNGGGTDYTMRVEVMRVETIRSKTSRLDEEVKTSKQSLHKALEFYCPNYQNMGNIHDEDAVPESTGRGRFVKKIKMRFQDIFSELDSLMTLTRISVDEMSSMSATIVAELTRRDAAVSTRTAKTGTLIAFLAMLYLPTATVATIFAMPIFNFDNDWRDWRYQPAPGPDSPSQNGTDTGTNTEARPPVFSGYFWIYLAISIGLSFITIEVWWRVTNDTNSISDSLEIPGDRPPHWILYPIWPHFRSHIYPKNMSTPSVGTATSWKQLDEFSATSDMNTTATTSATDEGRVLRGGSSPSVLRRMVPILRRTSLASPMADNV